MFLNAFRPFRFKTDGRPPNFAKWNWDVTAAEVGEMLLGTKFGESVLLGTNRAGRRPTGFVISNFNLLFPLKLFVTPD